MSGSGTNRSMIYLTVIICLVFGSVVGYLLAMNDYEPRIYEKDGLISDYLRQITDLNTSITSLNETLVYQDGNITAYKQEITELEALLIDAENQIEDQTDIITTLSNRITTLESQINITSSIFPEDWSYKKQITITGSPSGNLTDYQIKLNIHKGVGSDSTNNIYCNGHCQPDFDDIRFTESDGETLLNYWIEEITETQATVWVKINSIPEYPNNYIFYLYYGNSLAYSRSNGANTWEVFDDFSSISDWYSIRSTGSPLLSSVIFDGETTMRMLTNSHSEELQILHKQNISNITNKRYLTRTRHESWQADSYFVYTMARPSTGHSLYFRYASYFDEYQMSGGSRIDIYPHDYPDGPVGWNIYEMTYNGLELYVFRNDIPIMDSIYNDVNVEDVVLSYHILQFNGGTCDQYIDWVCIGNYVENEPTLSEISGEINTPT